MRVFRAARTSPGRAVGVVLLGLLLFLLLLWPLVMLGVGTFRTSSPLVPGGWSADALGRVDEEATRNGALRNSAILAVLSTVLGVALAVVLAFLSERTDTWLRRLIRPMVLVSVLISPAFYAIAYDLLANKYTGTLNVAAQDLLGTDGHVVNVESWPGIVCVSSLHASAFVYLYLVGPFRALDRTHEEASAAAGAGRWRTFSRINLPLLAPILSSVVLIGLVSGLESFDEPLILGTPADLGFLSPRIYDLLTEHNPPRYADASAIALGLALVVVLLAVVQHRVLAHRSYTIVTGKSYRTDVWHLGRARILGGAFVAAYGVLAVLLPLGSVVFASFQPFPGVVGDLSTKNYTALFNNPEIPGVVRTTLLLAVLGGLAAASLSFLLAVLGARAGRRSGAVLRGVTLLPLAMPGVIAAIAMTWAYATVPGLRELYGTVWLLMIAVVVAVLPVTVQIASGAIAQLHRELEDAARIAGATALRALLTVTVRLLLPSLLSGWLLAAILITGNLDAPLVLSGSGTRTVSVQTYLFFNDQNQGQSAALLTLTVGAGVLLGLVAAAVRAVARRAASRRNVPLVEPGLVAPEQPLPTGVSA
ncbi:iron ABC transporter permease [Actinomadura sp. NEAU-AAG7]|uniref:ABC transporter permease n=1 Tax=Actinomadura sp. NEAU-AAG7 TaxID=2839640 RepID=UPI001BE4447E|nr:ABC transporter permease subunit [Actinomadura sp. NEAU-AAG7]MBT2207259.1 ABC transporter permease subunit [Actinomadura sp. NEAU-AAG7]